MDKALTVLGEYRFWHPHRALCISPHFVRWGEIYPILGPRLKFLRCGLTMTLIASPPRRIEDIGGFRRLTFTPLYPL